MNEKLDVELLEDNNIENQEHFLKAILLGILVSIGCAILHSLFICLLDYSYNIAALFAYPVIGGVIAEAIKRFGKGTTLKFSIVSAILTLLCFILSDILTSLIFLADYAGSNGATFSEFIASIFSDFNLFWEFFILFNYIDVNTFTIIVYIFQLIGIIVAFLTIKKK